MTKVLHSNETCCVCVLTMLVLTPIAWHRFFQDSKQRPVQFVKDFTRDSVALPALPLP